MPAHDRSSPPAASPTIDVERIRAIVGAARQSGRSALLETEGYEVLRSAGIRVPGHRFVRDEAEAANLDLDSLTGDRLVVKVASPSIAHKTEVGGVAVVDRRRDAVVGAIREMDRRTGGAAAGYTIAEFVEHEPGIGGELLAALRWTDDFGPVVSVGGGGIDAEALAGHLLPGSRTAIVSPTVTPRSELGRCLAASAAPDIATTRRRGVAPRLDAAVLEATVGRLLELAARCCPDELAELEVNPFAITRDGLIALDVLATVGGPPRHPRPDRPLHLLGRLLEPGSIGIIGVSAGMNPGRIILRNLLRDGFDPANVQVVKPGLDEIDGCRCVPDLASLDGPLDLLVVAVSAAAAPDIVIEAIERGVAAGLIVIPGGLEEKRGTEGLVARMHGAVEGAWARGDGPLINGGNCLGIRSRPGRYDTLFIPGAKLPGPRGPAAPLAIIAQSGAFAISRLSRLGGVEPRYVITVGNQMDLTVGDYLDYLAADRAIEVFGVYVEGFAPLDGLRFARAARRISDDGRTVILYRGGRTRAGAVASASHTASIAGDAVVARALAEGAGVVVADTVEEFDDLLLTAARLLGRSVASNRLGAVTNAGFECVAIGDNLGPLRLAAFEPATTDRLREILGLHGISGVVDVHNPLDLTPMANGLAYEEVVRAVLEDPGVDLGLISVVPFTVELDTLPAGPDHREDLDAADGIAARLVALWHATRKPWVVSVDAGPRYDPFVDRLEAGGLPTFRTVDAAMRALGRWLETSAAGRGSKRFAAPEPSGVSEPPA